jgi:hypothetical protein
VILDDACRRQQAGEGHFPTFDDVPKEAFTVTCPGALPSGRLGLCRTGSAQGRSRTQRPRGPNLGGLSILDRRHPSERDGLPGRGIRRALIRPHWRLRAVSKRVYNRGPIRQAAHPVNFTVSNTLKS